MESFYTRAITTGRNDLLDFRLASLGLDRGTLVAEGIQIENIERHCQSCDVRRACEVDLAADPTNPVWECYCPNAGTLLAFSELWWIDQR